jgi:flagellar M-ring protein FliF
MNGMTDGAMNPDGSRAVQQIVDQLKIFYQGLGARERGIFTAAVLASLITLGGVFYWASQDTWQPVYTSSDPGDVQAAAAVLEEKGVPYRISPDGMRVETTMTNVGRARIEAAGAGKNPGFETLSEIKLGTSPQRERWAYQRALQGELVRTINGLDEVKASRVHLVLPERSAFLREERPASASITVQLEVGRTLKKSQILGITALVAGAVDGLDAESVVLVDDKGRLLSSDRDKDEMTMGMPALFEARQAYESRYRNTVINALTPILGSESAMSVAVTVDLDSTTVESTVKELDPNTQVTISEQVREEDSKDKTAGGVPGVEANLPEAGAANNNGSTERSSSELSSNYDYTTTQRHTVQRAGKIDRVNVAVMVDEARLAALVEAAGDGADVESIKAQINDTVRVAMGFDKERGDSIAVSFMPFSETVVDAGELIGDSWNPMDLAPYVIALVTLVLFFAFVIVPAMRAVASSQGSGGGTGGAGDVIARAAGRFGRGGKTGENEEGLNLAERLRMLVDNFEPVEAQDLNRLVELQMDASAQVLRRWVHN